MGNEYKQGSTVRSVLGGPTMTISNEGPLKAVPVGVGSRVVSGPTPSPDLIICKWFAGDKLQTKTVKKSELNVLSGPEAHDIEVNDIVELVSGGPHMLVTRVGPKSTAVGAAVIGGRVRQFAGATRNDLIGCKWLEGNGETTKEFEVGTLRLIKKR